MVLTWGTRAFCNKMLPCALDNDTISLLQIKRQGLVDGASFLNTSVNVLKLVVFKICWKFEATWMVIPRNGFHD